MITTRRTPSTPRLLAGLTLVASILAACGAAAAPSPSPIVPSPGAPGATPQPTPTPVPGEGGSGGPGGGTGGGTDPGSGGGSGGSTSGNVGSGILFPAPPGPVVDPLFGAASYLTRAAGLINLHPVNVQLVRAVVDAGGVATADLRWYSGVAPCHQLDSVQVQRDDAAKTIRLKVIEGSGPRDIACIDLAELHAVAVDLGELASGTWTISAEGDAPAVKLAVP